jgi:hypothetical protein
MLVCMHVAQVVSEAEKECMWLAGQSNGAKNPVLPFDWPGVAFFFLPFLSV